MFTDAETKEILDMKEKLKNYFHGNIVPNGNKIHDILSSCNVSIYEAFLTGGCFASLLTPGEIVNDFDIFFTNSDDAQKVYNYVIENMQEGIAEVTQYGSYVKTKKHITSNQVKLKNKLSFITFMSGTPEEIIQTFDFVHCTPRYDIANNKLYMTRDAYDCIKNKTMKLTKSMIVPEEYRIEKLKRRGWV